MRRTRPLLHEAVTRSIIGAFFEVYYELGFGFFEAVYGDALDIELRLRGHSVEREVRVPVLYKGHSVREQRIDRIVDEKVVVELKSTAMLPPGSKRQLYSYLRATRLEVGLLLHFGLGPEFHRLGYSNSRD